MPSDFDHRQCTKNCAGRTMRLMQVQPHRPDGEDGYERHVYHCSEMREHQPVRLRSAAEASNGGLTFVEKEMRMLSRPDDLAERTSDMRRPQTFRLPTGAARSKAREIIG